ncbi:hypothetical protein K4K58_001014 [Colletotrichum sp. SAR11_239]|nr:hypothetical protein K4K58_001014 [Colletotrichum sp. SAR11_239]
MVVVYIGEQARAPQTSKMKFTVAVCLLASYTGLAAAAGCQVELLNINQAVVGSGCVQMNYYANIYDSITRAGYTVNANNNCGLSFSGSQRIPDGYSLRRVGYC